MSSNLPYVNSTGALKKLLGKIQEASTPEMFNYDFLSTELGVSERAMIPLLKKIGFLSDDGRPTQRYRDFRNPDHSGLAMAEGIKDAYDAIYRRNEYAQSLSRDSLIKMIADITDKDHDSSPVKTTYTTFDVLRSFADFQAKSETKVQKIEKNDSDEELKQPNSNNGAPRGNVGFSLGYSVTLNLPETTNIEVYNAIFKSLNEHFLKHE